MKEVALETLVELAQKFHEEGAQWHFHTLTPDCVFNKRKDKFSFILENDTEQETYVAYSYTRQSSCCKELAKLLYGKNILEEESSSTPMGKGMEPILEKAERLNREGRPWHHHILFPHCILNKNKGKWAIVFEESEEGKAIQSITEHEPLDDVKKIEILYYSQKR